MKKRLIKVLASVLIVSLLIMIPFLASPQKAEAATVDTDSSQISFSVLYNRNTAKIQFNKLNAYRKEKGKKALKWDNNLEKHAQDRAAEICFVFTHNRPNALAQWGSLGNIYKGENIAKGYTGNDTVLADNILNGFKKSSAHNQNMLRTEFTAVGIAVYKFAGKNYTVQIFGSPKTVVNDTSKQNVTKTVKIEYNPKRLTSQMTSNRNADLSSNKTFTITDANLKNAKPLTLVVGKSHKYNTNMKRTLKWKDGSTTINAKVRLRSSNTKIVTVSGDTVTGKAKGTAKLTYYVDPIFGTQKTITVTVK